MGKKMQKRLYWNDNWQFMPTYTGKEDWKQAETVRLPHTVKETPFHYFDESIYQMLCAYRKVFWAEESWKGKHVFLNVEAAGHHAKIYLNGRLLTEHHCGYTAFQTDLMQELSFTQENELIIEVDSREQQNIPPFGHVVDYMTYGGLYREVYIEVKDTCYIEDVFVKTKRILKNSYELKGEVTLSNGTELIKEKEGLVFKQKLMAMDGHVIASYAEGEDTRKVNDITEWSLEQPKLYMLQTDLYENGRLTDSKCVKFGFREAVFKQDGFYLNGEKIKLRGLNRHQSYPYVGYAMPQSMQKLDADILKDELGANAVRTSHYPQSQHFVDRCDEIGLLVFTEIPGWQHIGDEAWKEQAVTNTKEMVKQYRNHPSIILWGVRINESQDDNNLYLRTNEAAHALDDTRQTSGVRYLQKSALLEDVYAYNDFSHEGKNAGCQKKKQNTPDMQKAYLISEYNGHMYPTKSYDAEDHRVEHMLRHARVMDAYYAEDDIAGGFAWCMFDYNTHQDFGSGDRICYHGVCDMFRNPKLAASVYQSQQAQEPVLEISSAMDIGEHPACLMKDVYAITNADSVNLYKNDVFIRTFYAKETPFSHMPHGPIRIDDFIGNQMEVGEGFSKGKSDDVKKILMSACKTGLGNLTLQTKLLAAKCMLFRGMKMQDAVDLYNKYVGNWGGTATTYKFEAVKHGKVVKTVIKRPMKTGHLEIFCSHLDLEERSTYDVALLRIRAVSEDGNLLSFCQEPLRLEARGPIAIIGPDMISLQGGMAGTYVKTIGQSGEASLTIKSGSFGEETVIFQVKERKNG